MLLLDGRKIRDEYKTELAKRVSVLPYPPKIAIVQVGDNEQSSIYIRQKIKFAESIGAKAVHVHLPEDSSMDEVSMAIEMQNRDESVNGIILQLPLPEGLDKNLLIEAIDPKKDVDGLTSSNQIALEKGSPRFVPATARAVMTILDFYKIPVKGKKVAVLGRSKLVGWPTSKLLEMRGANVTSCNSKTPNTKEIASAADIVIVAIGKPALIDESYIKAGAIVIDVGLTKVGNRLFGDIKHESVDKIVSAITPVPGGVGPVTVLSLFANLVESAEEKER